MKAAQSLRCICVALVLPLVSACAIADRYGPRAVDYNEEDRSSKSQSIMNNVLRAAYREPLQFTDVSSVTGTASVGATLSSSLPFSGVRGTGSQLYSLSPMLSASGGPSFSVANLNTQEFYKGLQDPIDMKLIYNYIKAGYSLDVLPPLFFSEIEIDNEADRFLLRENAERSEVYANFEALMFNLIKHGLDVEQQDKSVKIGPPLTARQAAEPKLLASFVQSSANKPEQSLKPVDVKAGPEGTSTRVFEISTVSKQPRFCFRPPSQSTAVQADQGFIRESAKPMKRLEPITLKYYPDRTPFIRVMAPPDAFCGVPPKKDEAESSKKSIANIKLTPRSLEGVFQFLGSIARTELGLGQPAVSLANEFPDRRIHQLFHIEADVRGEGYASTVFKGQRYGIRSDPSGADASTQVLQIVSDLLALKSSAKSLPPPNVISIVGQ